MALFTWNRHHVFKLAKPSILALDPDDEKLLKCHSIFAGMYYDYPEITPHNRKGDFRYNKANEKVTKFASNEVEVRALVEGQIMAKRLHVEKMGFKIGKNRCCCC